MKHHLLQRQVLALLSVLLLGTAFATIEVVPLPDEPPEIPFGHLPSPGECRIWMPGEPPGQQDAPGACETLSGQVPLGGWLIYRATPEAVGISAYSVDVEDLVGDIRYYDAKTLEPLEGPPAALPSAALDLPRGQLPALGECRIWHRGRPPGQQPAAGECARAARSVPAGALLLYRESVDRLVVTAYHPAVPGVALETRTLPIR